MLNWKLGGTTLKSLRPRHRPLPHEDKAVHRLIGVAGMNAAIVPYAVGPLIAWLAYEVEHRHCRQ